MVRVEWVTVQVRCNQSRVGAVKGSAAFALEYLEGVRRVMVVGGAGAVGVAMIATGR